VTANAGALYTTKGVAALLVPLGSVIKEMTGNWTTVLLCCAAVSIVAALASKLMLSPMRRSFIERSNLLDNPGQKDDNLTYGGQSARVDAAH
jgi:OFA family oxalate/formate antiporter-like MFS transporter